MVDITPNTTSFGIEAGPIAESAKNAQNAEIWAEGTDVQVEELGGTHSAKGWADYTEDVIENSGIDQLVDIFDDIQTVAGISSDVTEVASISAAVSTVSGHDSEVTLVADNMASVMTTASSITDVQNVASDITNINTVAVISSDVSTVATNSTAVNTAATNIAAIIAAPTAATNATNSAAEAQIWAEGTDGQVSPLGGEHSAKEWSNVAKYYAETIGAALKYKGSVATYSNLPSSGQQIGDFWNVLDTGKNYAWTGTEWDDISGIMDLSAYRTAAAQDVIDSGKQDTLVSGTNIKTINSNSLLGSGNIDIDSLPTQTGQSGKFLTTDGTDASWAEVNIPNNVWTQDNLVAGTNISITQVPQPVIDANTLYLCHFDGNDNDAISGTSWGLDYTSYQNSGKFDKALSFSLSSGYAAFAPTTNFNQNITLDFWVKPLGYNSLQTTGIQLYSLFNNSTIQLSTANGLELKGKFSAQNSDVTVPWKNIWAQWGEWMHFVYEVDATNSKIYAFINGHKAYEGTRQTSFSSNVDWKALYSSSTYGAWIDECRISNVVRWTSDFTPYSQPYQAGGAAQYQINNTAVTQTWTYNSSTENITIS